MTSSAGVNTESQRAVKDALNPGHFLPAGVPAPALPHYIDWCLERRGWVRTKFVCRADEGATCRLECAEHCGAESYPCGTEDDPHVLIDSGFCNVVQFLEEDPLDAYDGGPDMFSRSPIVVTWNGDYYSWHIAPQADPLSLPADVLAELAVITWLRARGWRVEP